jgi:solute carrier family 10 (sodium/bile acid cotransporter), member 7
MGNGLITKIKQQWFLIGLVLVFAGVLMDKTGRLAHAGNYLKMHHGSDIVIFIIFIISGLIIKVEEIKSGIKDVSATSIAIVTILIVAPLIAGLLSLFPLQKGLIIGLFIVAVMPTTLSSGIVMTGKAGGNMAHALFITIFSNAISVFSIPVILSWLLLLSFGGQDVEVDQIAIMVRLLLFVLLPLTIGLTAKKFFPEFKNDVKVKMQVINQLLIIVIVFMAASGSADMLSGNYEQLFLIGLIVTVFHIILLLFSYYSSKIFRIGKGRYESIVFMGSQKTLALAVILQLTYFSEYATALLVCVLHHFIHLIIDGYLCVRIKNEGR